jgi:hypothetical protein
MLVDLYDFTETMNYISLINDSKLDELVILIDGEKFKIPENIIAEWKYIGLSNRDLLLSINEETKTCGPSEIKLIKI